MPHLTNHKACQFWLCRISQSCPLLYITNALVQAFTIFNVNYSNIILSGVPLLYHMSSNPLHPDHRDTSKSQTVPLLCFKNKTNYNGSSRPRIQTPNLFNTKHLLHSKHTIFFHTCACWHALLWNAQTTSVTEKVSSVTTHLFQSTSSSNTLPCTFNHLLCSIQASIILW